MKQRRKKSPGRPRKPGVRHPSGKLVQAPIEPNAVILAQREAATGNLDVEPTPLNIALSRRWITEDQHRTAERYANLYRKAGFDLPALAGQDFNRTSRAVNHAFGDPEAMERLRGVWEKLRTPIVRELFSVCVQGELPWWIIYRLRGNLIAPSPWEQRRGMLLMGLDVVASTLDNRKNGYSFRKAG